MLPHIWASERMYLAGPAVIRRVKIGFFNMVESFVVGCKVTVKHNLKGEA